MSALNHRIAINDVNEMNITKKSTANTNRLKVGINIGVALEYFDFMIYGMLMPFMMPLFFQSTDPISNSLKAFSVFALGYVARPLGGILFGQFADRKGRRNAFTSAMLLMGGATLIIGLLPTADMFSSSFSALPAFLLVLCRLAQGLSFGAELPGAVTITTENNNKQKNATRCGFVISSTSIGAIFATGILAVLTHMLPPESLKSWGWRIPFFIGGTLAFVSWYLRKNMPETPSFSTLADTQKHSKPWAPVLSVITTQPGSVLIGIGLILLPAAMIVTNIFFASHLISFYRFEAPLVYSSMTIALVASVFLVPFFGWVADKFNIKTLFMSVCFASVILCQALFSLLDSYTNWGIISFLIGWQIFLCAAIACVLPWLTQLFPTKVRFTGVSLCYNIGYLFCAFLPNIYTVLMQNNPHIISYTLYVIAGIGLLAAMVAGKTQND
jgi:MHS family proline/betaine transporter-like MFS transporter